MGYPPVFLEDCPHFEHLESRLNGLLTPDGAVAPSSGEVSGYSGEL